MIVRKMRPEEFDATMTLVGYYADEAAQSVPGFADDYDENSARDTVRLYASNYEYSWFNAYDNTRPVGFIAGHLVACPWNQNITNAHIAFIYMLESHRTLANFQELLGQFEDWARIAKVKEITTGDIGINPERTKKIYEHFDFRADLSMSKELTNG
jgi:hypothetical protein